MPASPKREDRSARHPASRTSPRLKEMVKEAIGRSTAVKKPASSTLKPITRNTGAYRRRALTE